MRYFVNEKENTLMYESNGIYYPFVLSWLKADFQERGEKALHNEDSILKFGGDTIDNPEYKALVEGSTEVSREELIEILGG